MKSVIRPLVPPLIYGAANRLKARIGFGASIEYLPRASFEAAAREAGGGYRNVQLLTKFCAGTPNLTDMPDFMSAFLATVAIAACRNPGRVLDVMDFGGASGHYRGYVEAAFQGAVSTRWLVVEIPEQVANNGDADPALIEFSASVVDRRFDLAMFSGSLQYVDDWRAQISATTSDLIFIARTPIADREQAFLQTRHQPGEAPLRYPGRVIDRRELFALIGETHDLFASWKYDASLGAIGTFEAPAMLWRVR